MAGLSTIRHEGLQRELETAIEGVNIPALVDRLLAEFARGLAKALEPPPLTFPSVNKNVGQGTSAGLNFYDEVRRFEVELIQWALLQADGNQSLAARMLNVRTSTLNSKIKRYRIDWRARPAGDAAPPQK